MKMEFEVLHVVQYLYMLVQVIDPWHLRLGFRAKPEDSWFFSEAYESPVEIKRIYELCLAMKICRGFPDYGQFLFDYVHYRRGLSTNE